MTSNITRKIIQSFQRHSQAADAANVELSPREAKVLELLTREYLYKKIAKTLTISLPTVNTYIRRIYEKLHVHSRAQAVAKYAHIPLGENHRPSSTRG
jgi:DNA-binding NarL/FixJ family response regulator